MSDTPMSRFSPELERLARLHGDAAGAAAFRDFCTPRLSYYRSDDHDALVERARVHLRDAATAPVATSVGQVQAYVLEPENSAPRANVLLVHGWTGEASFMSAFGEYLRRRGFRAVLFDFPAHGRSPGETTSLMDCAHAVRDVAEVFGPINYVVAHSMGGLAAVLAAAGGPPMPRPCPMDAFVLVSYPDRFADVTREFGRQRGLTAEAQHDFEGRLEHLAERRLSEFTGTKLLAATGRPALLLHGRDDTEVPLRNAEQVVAAYGKAELAAFDGLGHRVILYAPPAIRAAAAFLEQQTEILTTMLSGRAERA